MNRDCKKFYQTISKSCDLVALRDGTHLLKMNELYSEHDHQMHLSFEAKNPRDVKKIHKLALISGGVCDGEPKVRSFNGQFSAYVIDPDGNRLEVVCSKKTSHGLQALKKVSLSKSI